MTATSPARYTKRPVTIDYPHDPDIFARAYGPAEEQK